MKRYTTEQIERALHHSQRPEQPLNGERKQAFLEELLAIPQPWYKRFWQLWLALPIAGAAVAGVIWYLNLQTAPPTQLANANLPVNVEVNEVISNEHSNLNGNENINTEVNTNTNNNANTNERSTEPMLTPRSNQLDERFYYGLGGGADYNYDAIQFIDPSFPVATSTASVKQRAVLGMPEIVQLAKHFAVPEEQSFLEENVYGVTETSCSAQFLQAAPDNCLNINAAGMIHYLAADSASISLEGTIQLIAQTTGLSAQRYRTQPLEDVQGSVAGYQHYHIYYTGSLATGLTYRDLGWDVYLRGGELHSLRGYVLPQMESSEMVNLITPQEALQAATTDFPNHSRLQFSRMYLEDLMRQNSSPTLRLDDFTLEYAYGLSDSQLALIPVYYLRATDTATQQELDLYIDATEAGNRFAAYELVVL